jgi:hypothetical protein
VGVKPKTFFQVTENHAAAYAERAATAHSVLPQFTALAAQTQAFHQGFVTLTVFLAQIIKKTPALTDHHQQTTAGMEILAVGLKMLGKVRDPLGKNGNLHICGTGIAVCDGKFFN